MPKRRVQPRIHRGYSPQLFGLLFGWWFSLQLGRVSTLGLAKGEASSLAVSATHFATTYPAGCLPSRWRSVTTPRSVAARPEPQQERTTSLDIQQDTPEALSLRELKQAASLRSSDEIYEYYDEISAIVKRYVEQKYHIKTLDATTGEILGSLPHDLTDPALDHVGEILRTCDMIHLSRHRPSQSDLDNIYRTTEEFFESQIKQPESEDESEDDLAELTKHYRRMV